MVQNGLRLYKLVQNGHFLPVKNGNTRQNDVHDGSYLPKTLSRGDLDMLDGDTGNYLLLW